MAYPYNEMGLNIGNEKGLNIERCYNVDEPRKGKEANQKRPHIVKFNVYEMSKICKYREIESRPVVFWEWGEKGQGHWE